MQHFQHFWWDLLTTLLVSSVDQTRKTFLQARWVFGWDHENGWLKTSFLVSNCLIPVLFTYLFKWNKGLWLGPDNHFLVPRSFLYPGSAVDHIGIDATITSLQWTHLQQLPPQQIHSGVQSVSTLYPLHSLNHHMVFYNIDLNTFCRAKWIFKSWQHYTTHVLVFCSTFSVIFSPSFLFPRKK